MRSILTFILSVLTFISFAQSQAVQPDEMPEFPGGSEAMMKFISENLKMPESIKKYSTFSWCKALITFSIDVDGSVKFPVVIRPCIPCQDCDREALRVIEMMPKWKPGKKDGKPIAVQQAIPLFFTRKP
jgi:protein TonB